MEQFSFIDPDYLKTTRNIANIATVLQLYVEAVYSEFKALRMSVKIANNYEENVPTFWRKILKLKDNEYPLLSSIMERIMVFRYTGTHF